MSRKKTVKRKTAETEITVTIDLDGTGKAEVSTGIGFFDHMLKSFARHGLFDLRVLVNGDLEVDDHHTVEDVGIVLGEAIKQAVGDKSAINRYGQSLLPMDETLVLCAVDLCGRPYLNFHASFQAERIGAFTTCLCKEFFYAISYAAMMNLHIKELDGENDHHICEAMFKAFARALCMAVTVNPRINGVLSTKESL